MHLELPQNPQSQSTKFKEVLPWLQSRKQNKHSKLMWWLWMKLLICFPTGGVNSLLTLVCWQTAKQCSDLWPTGHVSGGVIDFGKWPEGTGAQVEGGMRGQVSISLSFSLPFHPSLSRGWGQLQGGVGGRCVWGFHHRQQMVFSTQRTGWLVFRETGPQDLPRTLLTLCRKWSND